MKIRATLTAALMATTGWATMAAAQTELSMWYHGAGNQVEADILKQIIADFNASQWDWSVVVESFPQESYNDSVVAAALAGNLPDIIDVDGPVMPNWAWSGYLQPLQIDEVDVDRHRQHRGARIDPDRVVGPRRLAPVTLAARQRERRRR